MINTVQTKQAQLRDGFFRSGSGPTIILLLGSCRTLAYLNYLDTWNRQSGNKMTIYRIDSSDFHWNEQGQLTDFEAILLACEKDERILNVLRSTEIFIHEWHAHHGMFNTDKIDDRKNIYDFGLVPRLDICLPNFHDRFVLFNDQLQFNPGLRASIHAGGMTPEIFRRIVESGLAALDKFYQICSLSSFPEMEQHFRDHWTRRRFFYTGNHVSREFTLYLFRKLNEKYLQLQLDDSYWKSINDLDIFARPCTAVTQHDVDGYGLQWACPIESLNV